VKKTTRVLLATGATLAVLVGSGATAYAAHYQDRALPGSSVSGQGVSGLTRAELATALKERAQKVELTVTSGAGTQTASLADLGVGVDVDATVEKVFEANADWSAYAKALVSPHAVEPVVTVDDKVLEGFVGGLVAQEGTPAVNAAVERADGSTTFTVTPAVAGTTIDPASLQDVVKNAARTLTSASTEAKFVTLEAGVSTEAAQAVADKANAIVAAPLAITADSKTFEASAEDKAAWVQVPVTDGVPGDPTIDKAAVTQWVTAKADSLKVKAVNGVRNVSAATGEVLKVTTNAKDGAEVSNGAEVADAAVAALAGGQPYAGTFAVQTTKATWTDRKVAAGAENLAYPAAEGEKWVDVNLSNHTMTAYEGGRAVIGPVAMVNGAPATPTVTGTYKIYAKYAKQTMRGENADGTNYEAPDVPWVAYFHRGYALHGAPWRSSFGYTGSHGCVNLPVPTAGQVYAWAPIGTVVVSHY
jgi:lipoprotein-anchoring transpeptidase ErfK/SrfK